LPVWATFHRLPERCQSCGWHDPRGGVLQPLSYARGLAAAAISEGSTVCARSPVLGLHRDGDHWTLRLANGDIRAKQVIIATNAHTGSLWPDLGRTIIPVSSFQMATLPLPAEIRQRVLPGGQGVADTRRLLLYFRLDHTGRLVMGGRSPVDDNPSKTDAAPLRAAIERIFPGLTFDTIDYVWSGKVDITKDSMPHLHVLAPGLNAALGCNGRGLAMCTMMGKIIAELVSGIPPGDIAFPVTVPNTFALHAFRKLGVFAISQYYRLLDTLESRFT
jgi:glycine/D-amino acid oxidase-like deaminating enzyme